MRITVLYGGEEMIRIAIIDDNTVICSFLEDMLVKCIEVTPDMLKTNLLQRFICAIVRALSPML